MEDQEIVELYFRRDEQAIVQTDRKYGPYCYSVAYNVLSDQEDAGSASAIPTLPPGTGSRLPAQPAWGIPGENHPAPVH